MARVSEGNSVAKPRDGDVEKARRACQEIRTLHTGSVESLQKS